LSDHELLFKAFSDAYVKALEYVDVERFELAKTQYLLMLEFHDRMNNLGNNSLLEIANKNLREIFEKLKE